MFDLLHQRWFSHCGRQKPISQFFPFHFLFYVRKCFSHCSKGSSLLFLPLVCYWHSWQFLPQDLCYNAKICCSLHRASWPGWAATYQVECKSLKVMSSHPVSGIAHKSMYLCIVIYTYKSVHLYSVAFFDRLSCLKKLVGEFSGNLEQPLPPHPQKSCFCKGFLAKWPAKFWGFESLEENLARFKKKCQKLPATISLLQSNKPKEHEKSTICLFLIGEGVISNADNGWKNWFKKRNCDLRSQVQQVGNFWMDFCLFHIPEGHMCGNMC